MNAPIPTYDLYGEQRATRPHFWMHCETIASRSQLHRWEIRQHRHDRFFQILYMRGGTGEALLGRTPYPLKPGTAVTVPPGHPHGFRFARNVDGLVITFVAARLGALADAGVLTAEPHALQVGDDPYLTETLDRLGMALATGSTVSASLAEAYLSTALLLIRNLLAKADDASRGVGDDRRLERLAALVAAHAREHQPVSFYAGRLGVSPTHLNRLATAATGRTVTALLAEALAEEARRLLVFTGLGIGDIAAALGFADPAYFSRFFSHHEGTSPRTYRLSERRKLAD